MTRLTGEKGPALQYLGLTELHVGLRLLTVNMPQSPT